LEEYALQNPSYRFLEAAFRAAKDKHGKDKGKSLPLTRSHEPIVRLLARLRHMYQGKLQKSSSGSSAEALEPDF
jgi:hypothetical protein